MSGFVTVNVTHDACDACDDMVDRAISMARVTGSTGATYGGGGHEATVARDDTTADTKPPSHATTRPPTRPPEPSPTRKRPHSMTKPTREERDARLRAQAQAMRNVNMPRIRYDEDAR